MTHVYLMDSVLVGTLGDYQPGTTYEEKFPEINEFNTNYPDCTYLTNSQPAGDSSETVKYSFDTKAYYRLTPLQVDLDHEDLQDSIQETYEETEGVCVIRNYDNNRAPRSKIILRKASPENWDGDLLLTRNNTRIKVYTTSADGNEITFNGSDNKFSNSQLPTNLWVEGYNYSTNMMDTKLTLAVSDHPECDDTISCTVLWVDTFTIKYQDSTPQYGSTDPADYAADDRVSDDNEGMDSYNYIIYPNNCPHLGLNRYKDLGSDRFGWGFEVGAVVHPFNYTEENNAFPALGFVQDIENRAWNGTNIAIIYTKLFEEPPEYTEYKSDYSSISTNLSDWPQEGNDDPSVFFSDRTPSINNAQVFFLDAPGVPWKTSGHLSFTNVFIGDVIAYRSNMRVSITDRDGHRVGSTNMFFYESFDLQRQDNTNQPWVVLDNTNKTFGLGQLPSLAP